MTTEHLICIRSNNQFKLAQRGKYDGQFTGAGIRICRFIWANLLFPHSFDLFKKHVDVLQWASLREMDIAWKQCGKSWHEFESQFPEFSIKTSTYILDLIIDGLIDRVYDEREFRETSLDCQYSYCLDLDAKELHCWYETLEPLAKIPFSDCNAKKMKELQNQIIIW